MIFDHSRPRDDSQDSAAWGATHVAPWPVRLGATGEGLSGRDLVACCGQRLKQTSRKPLLQRDVVLAGIRALGGDPSTTREVTLSQAPTDGDRKWDPVERT